MNGSRQVSTSEVGLHLVAGQGGDSADALPATHVVRRHRRFRALENRRHVHARRRLDAAADELVRHCQDGDKPGAQRLIAALRAEIEPLVESGRDLAGDVFAARGLVTLLCEGYLVPAAVTPLADRLEARAGVDLLTTGLRALSDPQLLLLPLEESVEAVLALLEALGPLSTPAVWVRGTAGQPRLLRWRSAVPSSTVPTLVTRVFDGEPTATSEGWSATAVHSFQRTSAVITYCAAPAKAEQAAALTAALERLLSRAFERATLSVTNAEQSAALVRSSERRLTRLGFDLHDGPLQDVSLLGGEIAQIREALVRITPEDPRLRQVIDHVDDLDALVSCLDANLREVANSLDSAGEMRRPFGEALRSILRAFTAQARIEPEVELSGDVDGLSDSQRIALLRIVQESLTNVREHSQAEHVQVRIVVGATQVDASIVDDGTGFEVEPALRAAARGGRMGLLGMLERVRLLGGFCDVVSRPGEGTSVSLTVARWTPEMAALAAKQSAG